MSTLYDPRVSAACLALREDPPAALDGPILQYARDALAAAEVLGRASPGAWRRRTFAAIVAFIGVVGAVAVWERNELPAAPATPAPAAIERIAPPAPVVIVTPARAQLEATAPATVAKPKPAVAAKKKRAATPPKALVMEPRTVVPDEPVQVKTIAVDDELAPTPLAPPDPAPAIETATPSPEACAADPLTEGCATRS